MAIEGDQGPEVLVIDEQEALRRHLGEGLRPAGFRIRPAASWEEAQDLINRRLAVPEIILVEPVVRGDAEPIDLAQICSQVQPVPVVVVSSLRETRSIVAAIRAGAADYLCKPFAIAEVSQAIERLLQTNGSAGLEVARPRQSQSRFVFRNWRMRQIQEMIEQMAGIDVPVLIHGQTGVGKDVLARLIHSTSSRAMRQYVKVNCAALPSGLVESELFGHEKGAFTGAQTDRPGKFEFANGGTIFLDEITEFDPSTQAKLLHVLQEKRFSRLGSNLEIEVDVRVIAATNRDIEEAIKQGHFREDLYYRLNVVGIHVPPLRQRKDEIEILVRHFMEKISKEFDSPPPEVPDKLMKAFQDYHWPGNVRELENAVKRFVVLQDADSVIAELSQKSPEDLISDVEELTEGLLASESDSLNLKDIRKQAVGMVEESAIRKALVRARWNKLRTARRLGVSYKTLLNKIEHYEIRP